jgi:hypothetical protein
MAPHPSFSKIRVALGDRLDDALMSLMRLRCDLGQ